MKAREQRDAELKRGLGYLEDLRLTKQHVLLLTNKWELDRRRAQRLELELEVEQLRRKPKPKPKLTTWWTRLWTRAG